MHRANIEYFERKNALIIEAEELNAVPTVLPGNFVSGEQIMDVIGEIPQKIETEADDLESVMDNNFGRYLSNDVLQNLTQRWLRLQNR